MANLRLIASQNMRCDDKDIVLGDLVATVQTIHPLRSVLVMVLNGNVEVQTARESSPTPDADPVTEEPAAGAEPGDGEQIDVVVAPTRRTRRKPTE